MMMTTMIFIDCNWISTGWQRWWRWHLLTAIRFPPDGSGDDDDIYWLQVDFHPVGAVMTMIFIDCKWISTRWERWWRWYLLIAIGFPPGDSGDDDDIYWLQLDFHPVGAVMTMIFIDCNWISTRWERSVILYKNGEETALKEKQYTQQYKNTGYTK